MAVSGIVVRTQNASQLPTTASKSVTLLGRLCQHLDGERMKDFVCWSVNYSKLIRLSGGWTAYRRQQTKVEGCVYGNPSHLAMEHHLPYGIKQRYLRPDTVNEPCLNPSQVGTRFTCPWRMEGWVDLDAGCIL